MTVPEPGIYPGVAEHIYRAWPAVNQSLLKLVLRSPAHAYAERVRPSAPSDSQEFGAAFHRCILEPDVWREEYVVPPKCDRRTRIGKADWAAFVAENPDATHLKREQWDACKALSERCWNHPRIAPWLKGAGHNELSIVWRDEPTGLLCKGRIDRLGEWDGWPVVGDLKSTRDAGPRSFYRDAVYYYRYDFQAAFYLQGLSALAPVARRFWLVAVESARPYEPAVYELPDDVMDNAYDDVRTALDLYAECQESGRWPGYPEDVRILTRDGAVEQGGLG